MEQYGKIYNTKNVISTSKIHKLISEYFENPLMTKIKDNNNQSIYIAKIKSLLMNKNRYIVANIKKDDNNIGTKEKLQNLFWNSFQTRTLNIQYNIDSHSYNSNDQKFEIPIYIVNRTNTISQYSSDEISINIFLLHQKENNLYEYSDKGNLEAALETYNTIITI